MLSVCNITISFFFCFFIVRGAASTATPNMSVQLMEYGKKTIKSHFDWCEQVKIDMDALSFVISTDKKMSEEMTDAIREFLLPYGTGAPGSGVNFPARAIGSKDSTEGMFGCCGAKCKHLPEILQGEECLVTDVPLKIGLHKNCRGKLIHRLNEGGSTVFPASDSTGVCFDHQASATKPTFKTLVEAIINSCNMQTDSDPLHIIHVAQLGCRDPLQNIGDTHNLFDRIEAMRQCGLKVELIQFDIAFVAQVLRQNLIQASCTKPTNDTHTLLRGKGTTTEVYPLHEVPIDKHSTIEGTINVKKRKWGEMRHEIEIREDENNAAALYLSEADDYHALAINSDTIQSVKAYSTISHPLMSKRQKFPLKFNDMLHIGDRSIESIQTLAKNLGISLQEAFGIVRHHGIGFRIECSIRPSERDEFRERGHFNDILLLACMSVCEFLQEWKPAVKFLPCQTIETRAMKMVDELTSMVKFRHQLQFNEAYNNNKVTEWLRFHLSMVMITIGLIPVFSTKYIKEWLRDLADDRFDPFNQVGEEETRVNERLAAVNERMCTSLQTFCEEDLNFSRRGAQRLRDFVHSLDHEDPIECFKDLSLKDKLLLARRLWTDIIPHMSGFLSHQRNRPNLQDSHSHHGSVQSLDRDEDPDADDNNLRWWKQMDKYPQFMLERLITESPMPKHPLALAILSLVKTSTLWSPDRPGFNQMLCEFVLKSIETPSRHDEATVTLITRISNSDNISVRDLQSMCFYLNLTRSMRTKRSTMTEYQELICQHFHFPSSLLQLGINPQTEHYEAFLNRILNEESLKKESLNQILNDVLFSDRAILVSTVGPKKTYYRTAENSKIEINSVTELLQQIEGPLHYLVELESTQLYYILAKSLNSGHESEQVRSSEHDFLSRSDNIELLFLTSEGTTNKDFQGCRTLDQLQTKHSSGYPAEVSLSVYSLMHGLDIAFYNVQTEITVFFTCITSRSTSRSIKYEISGTNWIPLSSRVLKLTFSWNSKNKFAKITTEDNELPIISHTDDYSVNPIAHDLQRIRIKNLSDVPNAKRSRARDRPFITALSSLLAKLDPQYLVEESGDQIPERLGLISFLEELSCHHPGRFDGFHESTTNQCPELGHALKLLACSLKQSVRWKELGHKLWCPIACLKHHNLILCVLEKIGSTKTTYYYAYIPDKQRVECIQYPAGYWKYTYRPKTLYLYCSEKTSQEYHPQTDPRLIEENLWRHTDSLVGQFSHIPQCSLASSFFPRFESSFGMTQFYYKGDPKDYQLRPEEGSAVVATSVTSCSGHMSHLNVKGISHSALVLIFPNNEQARPQWDVCIVHHPLQCPSYTTQELKRITAIASQRGGSAVYTHHTIKGRSVECSESRFLIILYAYLGWKCSSINQFKTAMEKVNSERDLIENVRLWTRDVMQEKRSRPPYWVMHLCPPQMSSHTSNFSATTPSTLSTSTTSSTTTTNAGTREHARKRTHPTTSKQTSTATPPSKKVRTAEAMAIAMEACMDRGDCAVRWRMQPAAGLQNPRGKNLCYINAVAQLLHGMKCTRELFLMGRFWSGHDLSSARKFAEFGEKGGFVACALQQLFNRMQFRNGRPIATALKDSLLMNSSFANFDNDLQQDATEFLSLVLCVLTAILRKNGRDPISSLFCSPVVSCVRCSECGMHRENFSDKSIILHVPIVGTTIQDSLLHGFFEQERIDEWICDKECNSHGTKGLSLESRNILVLSLKRFPNHGRKDDTLVTFPLDGLDTAPFMHRPDEFQTTYKLAAVINHIGNSLSRGHYTLSMRFGANTWHNCDDESVRLISSAEVVTEHAYTLVYCLSDKYHDLISHEETAS